MHTLTSAPPSGELKAVVRAYAQRTTAAYDPELVQRVPASLEQIIEFEFGTPPIINYWDGMNEPAHRVSIVGAHSFSRASLRLRGGVESFVIFLQPVALQQLLGLPAHHLVDRSFHASDVFGGEVDMVWAELAHARSFAERVQVAECFLLQIRRATQATTISRVAMKIIRGRGRMGVNEMAGCSSLSVRQFERRFEREIGLPPKLFARIARFQSALDAKVASPTRTWLDVANSVGYYDQMHLVRDFKNLGGTNPTQLMMQLGDARPPALVDSNW